MIYHVFDEISQQAVQISWKPAGDTAHMPKDVGILVTLVRWDSDVEESSMDYLATKMMIIWPVWRCR